METKNLKLIRTQDNDCLVICSKDQEVPDWDYWKLGNEENIPSNLNKDQLSFSGRTSNVEIDVDWFNKILNDLVQITTCDHCGIEFYSEPFESDLYDSPFDNATNNMQFCSYDCYDAFKGHYYSKDYNYFTCIDCDREVCEQSPQNGYHTQYRVIDSEMICLKCYEENALEYGMPIEYFEDSIPGMFMNSGDLEQAGYKEHSTKFVNHSNTDSILKECRDLTEQFKVFVEYDRLGLGGSEGTITIWTK